MSEIPERVIVLAPSWLGDAVMATPAFIALRNAWPHARITLVCRPGIDGILADLATDRAVFDDVVVDRFAGALGPLRGGRRLRSLRADIGILFPNSFRSALALRLSGAARRVGYDRDGRGLLLTDRVAAPAARPVSTVDFYCDLVQTGLGIAITDRRPRLGLCDADRSAAVRALEGTARPFALLIPGGNNPAKRWPAERFAAIAAQLLRVHGIASAVSGSPEERETIAEVLAASTVPIVDLTSYPLSLGGLKAIVASARLVITNDTGPRHIAAAFRIPSVALFGPTDHRWTVLRDVPERVLIAEPFLPEELVADDRQAYCRIDRIAIADVSAAIASLLRTHTEA